MFLHEDKAYCFGAAEFQTVLEANSTNASMSKGVQRCWQCLPPAAAAMDQHCRDCLHTESPHIFTQTFLTIFLAPFPICCKACGQVWCTLLGGSQPQWGEVLEQCGEEALRPVSLHAMDPESGCSRAEALPLSNAEADPPAWGTGTVWVANDKIQ